MEQKIVLVVCNGNIHRSVIAQLCLSRELANLGQEREFLVISRGIQGTMGTPAPKHPNLYGYQKEYGFTRPWLEKIGIEIPVDQRATPIDEAIVERASLILVMETAVLDTKENSLMRQFPGHVSKMRLFMELVGKKEDEPDCYGSNEASLYQQMVTSINEVAKAGILNLIRWARESN